MGANVVLEALIIADGERLDGARLNALSINKTVVALDGAYIYAKKQNLAVDYLLGDFDSLAVLALNQARADGVEVVSLSDQNFTDLEKALQFLKQREDYNVLHIAMATGCRLDHTLYNLRLLTRYYAKQPRLIIHTATERVFVVKDERCICASEPGAGFAVLAAPECLVTSQGLAYELSQKTLSYHGQDSVCNQCLAGEVTLDVKGCALVVQDVGDSIDMSLQFC